MCGCTCAGRRCTTLAHIGNARPVVVFDVLARLLRRLYPRVTYVRNITDVEDKINARAARDRRADRQHHRADHGRFPRRHGGTRRPAAGRGAARHRAHPGDDRDHRAADRRRPRLRGRGPCAVLGRQLSPSTATCPAARPDELLAGARVDVAPYKRDAGDFVLWKPSPTETAGLGQPLGPRPAGLAHRVLARCPGAIWARRFDIHGGGQDLIFPHHENEIAQSLLRLPRQRLRPLLAAQRHAAGERREDVEEPRQLLHRARGAGEGPGRGDPPVAAARRIIAARSTFPTRR